MHLRAFVIDTPDRPNQLADAIGDEPIYHAGDVKGWVTSGGYAAAAGVSVAMGYIPKDLADDKDGFEIELLGQRLTARPQDHPLFDPTGLRMRS